MPDETANFALLEAPKTNVNVERYVVMQERARQGFSHFAANSSDKGEAHGCGVRFPSSAIPRGGGDVVRAGI